jgi:NAD(P)-dependent dehydrogenase (short-subunit alcohol dehydrogenase family)
MRFQDRVAIITGGTGGLGRAIVQMFASEGASVAVPVHRQHTIDAADLPPLTERQQVFLFPADLVTSEGAAAFVQKVLLECKRVDFLIHTVGGYAGGKAVEEVSDEEWSALMDLNLKSAFLMCRSVLPLMRNQGFGRIITIGAMAALRPVPKRGPYQISKRALITLTETIAEEVKRTGITANAIIPSTILTGGNIRSMPDADHATWVTPEEIATLVGYLCQTQARSISGNAIKIYGGV